MQHENLIYIYIVEWFPQSNYLTYPPAQLVTTGKRGQGEHLRVTLLAKFIHNIFNHHHNTVHGIYVCMF